MLVNTVTDKHISAMVNLMWVDGWDYTYRRKIHDFADRQAVGQILLDENYRSVNCCYSRNEKAPRFQLNRRVKLSPIAVIRLCRDYLDQISATRNCRMTQAYAIVNATIEHALHSIPGYTEAESTI